MTENTNDNSWSNYFEGVGIDKISFLESIQHSMDGAFIDIREKKLYIPKSLYQKYQTELYFCEKKNYAIFAFGQDKNNYSLWPIIDTEFISEYFVLTVSKIVKGPNYVTTNIELGEINECTFEMIYPNFQNLNAMIENTTLQYDNKTTIEITNNGVLNSKLHISLKMVSKEPRDLSTYLYYILEMLFLYLGTNPENITMTIKNDTGHYTIYENQVRKYNHLPLLSSQTILQKINSNTISVDILNNFIKFRETKDGRFLFDKFLDACNSEMYPENSCVYLIDILEGASLIFKPLSEKQVGKKQTDKDIEISNDVSGKNGKEKMDHALACYVGYGVGHMPDVLKFNDNEETNKNCVVKFRKELRNLRNDHSHFTFKRKTKYKGEQYVDLKFRLEILIRLIFMDKFSIQVDDDLFDKVMASVYKYESVNNVNLIKFDSK